jgi:hypothetical protein
MSRINNAITEIKDFGFGYLWEHTRYNATKSAEYLQRMDSRRDKVYSRMTEDELLDATQSIYNRMMGLHSDIRHPETFSEKIQWLKVMDATPIKTQLSDKILVKDWISKKIGSEYVIPTVGAVEGYSSFDEINFEELPSKFILKLNTGSGMNYPVKEKSSLDVENAKKTIDQWMTYHYHWNSIELQYRDIQKRVFAEKYIEEMDGNLYDYKIPCFGGKPMWIECTGDRNLLKHTGYQRYFDLDWNSLDWSDETYPDFQHDVAKPDCLDEMIRIARELSKGFKFVRVDLYDVNGRVLFGEMSFTPSSGLVPYKGRWNREKDLEIGKLLVI